MELPIHIKRLSPLLCFLWLAVTVSHTATAQWVQTNGPKAAANIWAFATTETDLLVGTDGDGIYRTTDKGQNWSRADSGLSQPWAISLASVSMLGGGVHLFAGTSDGTFLSTDHGRYWTRVVPQLDLPDPNCFAVSGTRVFAGTNGGVYRCAYNGQNWVVQPPSGAIQWIRVFSIAVSGNTVYAGTDQFGVYASTDSGATWTAVKNGLPNEPGGGGLAAISALVATSSGIFAGSSAGLYRSDDNGLNWTSSGTGIDESVISCLINTGPALFAGTEGGVYASTDGGTTWQLVNSGLSVTNNTCLAADSENLYGAFYESPAPLNGKTASVWRRPLAEMITSVEPLAGVSRLEFSLDQNYPNPFNPTTGIRFQVTGGRGAGGEGRGSGTWVRLTVYDLLGREIAILVDENKAPGSYQVNFDGSGLASGVYLYRLQAGGFVDTKKLLLLE